MFRFRDIVDLRAHLRDIRGREPIVLVPTMGSLHAGHQALVRRARQLGGQVLVSIFVNPTQFDDSEDYRRYPRSPDADCGLLQELGVDSVFIPEIKQMYPEDEAQQPVIRFGPLEDMYCGQSRPGHFRGVGTVVCKLFNIVQPDHAVFGEKDYQQLLLIRRLVCALNFPIRIHAVPTVREADGLALSSRNRLLEAGQRRQAGALYQTLKYLATRMAGGELDYGELENQGCERLREAGLSPEYIAICDAETLLAPGAGSKVVLAAARVGDVRLIDNIIVQRNNAEFGH